MDGEEILDFFILECSQSQKSTHSLQIYNILKL